MRSIFSTLYCPTFRCKPLYLTLFILTIITLLSLWPLPKLPPVPGSDKTHHIVAYAALILPTAVKKTKYWWAIALGFVSWSGAIELLQPYVNRYGEWADMVANVTGLIVGYLIAILLEKIFGDRQKNNNFK